MRRTAEGGHRPRAPDPLAECFAIDVGHDEEHDVTVLLDEVNGNDVRVGQLGGGPGLPQEALA